MQATEQERAAIWAKINDWPTWRDGTEEENIALARLTIEYEAMRTPEQRKSEEGTTHIVRYSNLTYFLLDKRLQDARVENIEDKWTFLELIHKLCMYALEVDNVNFVFYIVNELNKCIKSKLAWIMLTDKAGQPMIYENGSDRVLTYTVTAAVLLARPLHRDPVESLALLQCLLYSDDFNATVMGEQDTFPEPDDITCLTTTQYNWGHSLLLKTWSLLRYDSEGSIVANSDLPFSNEPYFHTCLAHFKRSLMWFISPASGIPIRVGEFEQLDDDSISIVQKYRTDASNLFLYLFHLPALSYDSDIALALIDTVYRSLREEERWTDMEITSCFLSMTCTFSSGMQTIKKWSSSYHHARLLSLLLQYCKDNHIDVGDVKHTFNAWFKFVVDLDVVVVEALERFAIVVYESDAKSESVLRALRDVHRKDVIRTMKLAIPLFSKQYLLDRYRRQIERDLASIMVDEPKTMRFVMLRELADIYHGWTVKGYGTTRKGVHADVGMTVLALHRKLGGPPRPGQVIPDAAHHNIVANIMEMHLGIDPTSVKPFTHTHNFTDVVDGQVVPRSETIIAETPFDGDYEVARGMYQISRDLVRRASSLRPYEPMPGAHTMTDLVHALDKIGIRNDLRSAVDVQAARIQVASCIVDLKQQLRAAKKRAFEEDASEKPTEHDDGGVMDMDMREDDDEPSARRMKPKQ